MLTLRHILETLVSHDCAKVSSDYRRCSVVEGEVRGGADSGGDPLDTAAGVCKKLLKKDTRSSVENLRVSMDMGFSVVGVVLS